MELSRIRQNADNPMGSPRTLFPLTPTFSPDTVGGEGARLPMPAQANTTMLCRLNATARPSGATIQVDWLV